jgi:hypothetical protein
VPQATTEEREDRRRLKEMSTAELLRHAVDEARLLVRAEVLHARRELQEELAQARRMAGLLGAAAVLALCGLSGLFVALGMALPGPAGRGVAWVAAVELALAGGLAVLGYRAAPKKPLARTRARLSDEAGDVREWFPWA